MNKRAVYFKINVRSAERLEKAQDFARALQASGIDIADWFFGRVEKFLKDSPRELTQGYMTPMAVIEQARRLHGIDLTLNDLQYWRDKRTKPRLRRNVDYIESDQKRGRDKFLYKKSRMNQFYEWIKQFRLEKEMKRAKKQAFPSEKQEWTSDPALMRRKIERKVFKNRLSVKPIVVHREEEG